jgi:hypothetical protein
MKNYITLIYILLFVFTGNLHAQDFSFLLENQFSTWLSARKDKPWQYQTGGRYIPTLTIANQTKKGRLFDAELSVNTYANAFFKGTKYDNSDKDFKPYRMWIRYSTPRLELRAGLQKINFGSATIFRPLMWFDKMDFRDPLQLTDGVYGILGRYYFPGNMNIWGWVLRGNDKVKGWETAPSKKNQNEYGGRFQVPVFTGELGLSYHNRKADFSAFYPMAQTTDKTWFPEELVGIDGKWDLGIGLWFEYVNKKNDRDNIVVTNTETFLNVGMDYTFGIGNGLSITSEYFWYSNHAGNDQQKISKNYAALAVGYPFGLMNNVSGMVYYDRDTKEWFRFVNISRKYDYWSYYLMAYWNPGDSALYGSGNKSFFAGKGVQVMAVVNF